MNEEAAFIAVLVKEPTDKTAALVFADWLDERSDPRGPMIRIDEVRAWMAPEYANPLPKLRAAIETGKRITDASKALALIGEAAIPELLSLLTNETPLIRARAAKTLRLMGPRAKIALPNLLAMAKDPFSVVRCEATSAAKAVVAGGSKADTEATTVLREALHDKDAGVRGRAASLLGSMRARRAVKDDLAKGLESQDPAERLAAVEAITSLRTKTAAGSLCKVLGDTDVAIRRAAARQLASLSSPTMTVAVEPLREAIRDKDADVRHWSITALADMGPAAVVALPDLLAMLGKGGGKDHASILSAVGQIGVGKPEVLDVLLVALNDPDENVRFTVSHTLRMWPVFPASAAPALLKFAAIPNRANVHSGLDALTRITDPPPEVLAAFRKWLIEDCSRVAHMIGKSKSLMAALLPDLIAAFQPTAGYGIRNIGELLGKIGGDGIAALVKGLDHESGDERNSFACVAAQGLAEAGSAALPVLPALLARLRKPKYPDVRARVVDAIAAIGSSAASAIPDLIAAASEEKFQGHTASVVNALHKFGPAVVPFVPQLVEWLRQPIRANHHSDIIRLLTTLIPHGVEVLPVFRDVLRQATTSNVYQTHTTRVAFAAIQGLAALGPAAAPAIPDLALAYQTFGGGAPSDFRETLLAAYGKIGVAAIPHIRLALGDSVWRIRSAAVEALGATGDTSEETFAAIRTAETDAAQNVRKSAATVLKKLESSSKKRRTQE